MRWRSSVEALGGVDVLINNAGAAAHQPFPSVTADQWGWIIAVNLRSMFLVVQAVEIEAPSEEHRRLDREPHRLTSHRPWGDLLSDQLLDDLRVWNDSWDFTVVREDEEEVPRRCCASGAESWRSECRTRWGQMAGKCSGSRTARPTACTLREAGQMTPGNGTFWLRAARSAEASRGRRLNP